MISESHLWKGDLAKRATWLLGKRKQRRWPNSAYVRVEQCVMIGCYCVRKLIEANKITDSTSKHRLRLRVHRSKGKPVHLINRHHLDELYEFDRSTCQQRSIRIVCNQIIHSYVFMLGFDNEGGLDSVLFCSDYERNSKLFNLPITELADAFTQVSADYPVEGHLTWNSNRNDYDIKKLK